ncbi:TetR/AcrR family transcriptional regulator [Kineococcus sp. SYSU DK002]|uniref:TetR/AcrR family transcriptional regulator n=1 Tax=Kineococcus sp. SYSU DK002 TaxID=3383123 RepID=UPI003D7CD854
MPTRTEKARATRRRVLDAACQLFTERGYGATSVRRIAAAAGVAEQTVYFTFGTKAAVLAGVLDVAVAGDDADVPTLERPWARAVLAEPDPRRQLHLQAAGAADVLARVAGSLQVLRAAADADPAAAELLTRNEAQQRTVQRAFLAALAGKATLRRDLDRAVDVATTVLSDHSWRRLAAAGWSGPDWVGLSAGVLAADLLGTPPGTSPRTPG